MKKTLLKTILSSYNNYIITKIKNKCSDEDYQNLSFLVLNLPLQFNNIYETLVENYKNFHSEISEEKYDVDTNEYYEDIYRQIFYLEFKKLINLYELNYTSKNLYNKEVSEILSKNKLKNFVDIIIMFIYLQTNITSISFAETKKLCSENVEVRIGSDKVKMLKSFVNGNNRNYSKYIVNGMMEQEEVKKIFSHNRVK